MPRVFSLPLVLALLLLGGLTEAGAQRRSPRTISLFAGAPAESRSHDVQGMRRESVGAIARFPLALGAAGNLRARSSEPRRLQIALPGGSSVTCMLRPASRRQSMVVLAGAPVGGREGERCNLVIENGQVVGEVDLESGRYRIQPVGPGVTHAVVEVKTENLPDEIAPRVPAEPAPQRAAGDEAPCDVEPAPGQQPKTLGPIRIMILYTKAVAASTPSIRADIELIMQQLRTGFGTTRLGGNFSVATELAHAQEINYVESDGMDKDLDRLSNPRDAVFRPVHALRDTHKADIVHLLIKAKPNNGCGIGWLNLSLRPEHAFSVSDHQCAVQNFSAVHEIGHNIGLTHDRFVEKDAKPGPTAFNFGFVSMLRGTRSLMSYNNQCAEQKKHCRRLLQVSSPRVKVGGVAFGNPMSHPEAAYNVEVLCRNAAAASNFR